MDIELQDRLNNYFNNIEIEVDFHAFREYKIFVILNETLIKFLFKYDASLTLDANVDIIRKEIERCILNYYKKSKTI